MDVNFIFSIIVLIFSVVLHELSHAIAADALGDPTPRMQGRITLNPFPHLDLVGSFLLPVLTYNLGGFIFGWAKPVEFNPYNLRNQRWGEAIIAAAGPITNFLIAIVFGLIVRFSDAIGISESMAMLASIVALVNISLGLFNLIPIPPLDGSKLLFSIIPDRYYGFRAWYERYSLIIFVLFLLAGASVLGAGVTFIFRLIVGV